MYSTKNKTPLKEEKKTTTVMDVIPRLTDIRIIGGKSGVRMASLQHTTSSVNPIVESSQTSMFSWVLMVVFVYILYKNVNS